MLLEQSEYRWRPSTAAIRERIVVVALNISHFLEGFRSHGAGEHSERARRLPVVDTGGTLLGILSINDILLAVAADGDVEPEAVVRTLQAICAHQR